MKRFQVQEGDISFPGDYKTPSVGGPWVARRDVNTGQLVWDQPRIGSSLTDQQTIGDWVSRTFGSSAMNVIERARRVGEEALELIQTQGVTREQMHQLVDSVYDRPPGNAHQEAGGLMLCLLAWAHAKRVDLSVLKDLEIARVLAIPKEVFHKRHDEKVALGTSQARDA